MLTFAGPCSFDEIFHHIFAHPELYFVDNGFDVTITPRSQLPPDPVKKQTIIK